MKVNRRKFLALLGGAAAIGVSGKAVYEVVARNEIMEIANKNLAGKRWAMVIDLHKINEGDNFSKCIGACNNSHNVPKIKNKNHEIKWIWKEDYEHAFIEQENKHLPKKVEELKVPLLCNHCSNPPCTNVCPTQATWKRVDGIVMMDWHRCIGCRYCIAACPYGSRSFNFIEPREHIAELNDTYPARTKGVVEKCTFCAEYCVDGDYFKMPDCVNAVSEGAMYFGNLNDKNSDVVKVLSERFSIRRKPELGTEPEVYYLIDEEV